MILAHSWRRRRTLPRISFQFFFEVTTAGKPEVPLCFSDGFHHRAVSRTVKNYKIDRVSFAKDTCVQLWRRRDGIYFANKATISSTQVHNKSPVSEKPFIFAYNILTIIKSCRLFFQHHALPNVSEFFVTELVMAIYLQRRLCNVEDRQLSRFNTVCTRISFGEE